MNILKSIMIVATAGAMLASVSSPAEAQKLSDAAIRQKIVKASIAAYPGNCPCPYNSDRAGRSCGRRSAYNRAGGYAPLCYASDISAAEVRAYRASR